MIELKESGRKKFPPPIETTRDESRARTRLHGGLPATSPRLPRMQHKMAGWKIPVGTVKGEGEMVHSKER